MQNLNTVEPTDLSDESIAEEVGCARDIIQLGYEAVSTGDYGDNLNNGVPDRIKRVMNPKSGYENELYNNFLKWRDYGFNGQFPEELGSPQDAYALVLMSYPAVELFNGSHAYNCEAILQCLVARLKIDLATEKIVLSPYSDIRACEDFCVGGKYKGLTYYELALLSKMTVQAVKNELRKPGSPKTSREQINVYDMEEFRTVNGLVTVDPRQAYEWLKGRRGFTETYAINSFTDENVLVPQAKDGSFFNAKCRLGQGYKIGKKGEEKYIDNFFDALAELQKMPKAYWRRPSRSSGVSGIVSASTWVTKTKSELNIH